MAELMRDWLGSVVETQLKYAVEWKRRGSNSNPEASVDFDNRAPSTGTVQVSTKAVARTSITEDSTAVSDRLDRRRFKSTYSYDGSNLRATIEYPHTTSLAVQVYQLQQQKHPFRCLISDGFTLIPATFSKAVVASIKSQYKRDIPFLGSNVILSIPTFELIASKLGFQAISVRIKSAHVLLANNATTFGHPHPVKDRPEVIHWAAQLISVIACQEHTSPHASPSHSGLPSNPTGESQGFATQVVGNDTADFEILQGTNLAGPVAPPRNDDRIVSGSKPDYDTKLHRRWQRSRLLAVPDPLAALELHPRFITPSSRGSLPDVQPCSRYSSRADRNEHRTSRPEAVARLGLVSPVLPPQRDTNVEDSLPDANVLSADSLDNGPTLSCQVEQADESSMKNHAHCHETNDVEIVDRNAAPTMADDAAGNGGKDFHVTQIPEASATLADKISNSTAASKSATSWAQVPALTRFICTVPKDQAALLSRPESWYPPDSGKTFPTPNLPRALLEKLRCAEVKLADSVDILTNLPPHDMRQTADTQNKLDRAVASVSRSKVDLHSAYQATSHNTPTRQRLKRAHSSATAPSCEEDSAGQASSDEVDEAFSDWDPSPAQPRSGPRAEELPPDSSGLLANFQSPTNQFPVIMDMNDRSAPKKLQIVIPSIIPTQQGIPNVEFGATVPAPNALDEYKLGSSVRTSNIFSSAVRVADTPNASASRKPSQSNTDSEILEPSLRVFSASKEPVPTPDADADAAHGVYRNRQLNRPGDMHGSLNSDISPEVTREPVEVHLQDDTSSPVYGNAQSYFNNVNNQPCPTSRPTSAQLADVGTTGLQTLLRDPDNTDRMSPSEEGEITEDHPMVGVDRSHAIPSSPPSAISKDGDTLMTDVAEPKQAVAEISRFGFTQEEPVLEDPALQVRQMKQQFFATSRLGIPPSIVKQEPREEVEIIPPERHNLNRTSEQMPATSFPNAPPHFFGSLPTVAGPSYAAVPTTMPRAWGERPPMYAPMPAPMPAPYVAPLGIPVVNAERAQCLFDSFKTVYHFDADLMLFIGCLKSIIQLDEERKLHPGLWDDYIIRHRYNYLPYALAAASNAQQAMPYHEFYHNLPLKQSANSLGIVNPSSLRACCSLNGNRLQPSGPNPADFYHLGSGDQRRAYDTGSSNEHHAHHTGTSDQRHARSPPNQREVLLEDCPEYRGGPFPRVKVEIKTEDESAASFGDRANHASRSTNRCRSPSPNRSLPSSSFWTGRIAPVVNHNLCDHGFGPGSTYRPGETEEDRFLPEFRWRQHPANHRTSGNWQGYINGRGNAEDMWNQQRSMNAFTQAFMSTKSFRNDMQGTENNQRLNVLGWEL